MRRRILIATVLLTSVLVWTAAAVTVRASWRVVRELARATPLAEIGPHPQSTVVFDRQNRQVFSFFVEQRVDVPLDRVSPHMIDALLAVEDRRFYSHHGLDAVRIVKAAWRNWRSGRIVEGGSTITQQLARLEQLTPARTFSRKIREVTIAVRLEERYSKQEILHAYLNAVYFGDGYHGVEAASRGYFGKSAADLEPHEAALLAGIVRSPGGYSPSNSPRRALARRNLVLRLMRDTGRLTEAEYRASVDMPLRAPAPVAAVATSNASCGRYFEEEVRRQLGLQIAHHTHPDQVLVNQRRAAAQVQRHHRQRLIHRQHEISRAVDSFSVAQRLGEQLSQHDPDVFHRVVLVHVQIARGAQL